MNALDLKRTEPIRMMVVGRPGTQKTGSLVPLAEAGFKLRILDYDGNAAPILRFASDAALANIDIVRLEDEYRVAEKYIEVKGIPRAFEDGLNMLKHWHYKAEDGTEVDLGASRDWGLDTIVVLDSLTNFGEAAKDRTMVKMNKTPLNNTQRVWGMAQTDVQRAIKIMKGGNFHLIINSHLKMIGPKLPSDEKDPEKAELALDLAARMAEVIPTRLYPSTPGQALAQTIAGEVPIVVRAEVITYQGREQRVFTADPALDTDLKLPAKLKGPMPAGTAMVTIFKALGATPPCGWPAVAKE